MVWIRQRLLVAHIMRWFTANKMKKENKKTRKTGLAIYEMTLFSMFGALIFGSKVLMEVLPNIHLVGMFTILLTVVYRAKALIPLYIFVLLNGLISGFNMWWIPYTYIWTILWAVTMLLPKEMNSKVGAFVYPLICAVHGFLFGALYAPAQAIMYGFSFEQTVAWIMAGLPFDAIHGVSNLIAGLLVLPLSKVLKKLNSSVTLRIG